MFARPLPLLAFSLLALAGPGAPAAEPDPERGAQAFRQCAACHSLAPGAHLTGPSLAGVVGRKAGAAPGFRRYSEALASAELRWTPENLDRWLADPAGLVPGTSMRIRPIADPQLRRDLVAFLARGAASPARDSGGGGMGGGMMGGGRMLDLRAAGADRRVTAIGYCPDAYRVRLASGETHTFWEFNLRFKTDSSAKGPPPGAPAIVGQGMRGDRAQIVFSSPAEMAAFIRTRCPPG